ncbi:MAG: hypothetical protein V4439_02655 [Patescibacteria group bacterium]
MKIAEYFDKNNLHHAYLIEGIREEILPEVLEYVQSLGIETNANPDFLNIVVDNFKIDEAFSLRDMGNQKSFSTGKKFFIVCANNFTLDAQNVLLKMFEEPIFNTHFFLIVPDTDALLRTLVSRFYLIKNKSEENKDNKNEEAEKFIKMPLAKRIDFLKELLKKDDEDDIALDSTRTRALKFLNNLELALHNNMSKMPSDISFFNQIFKAREFLRQPGSAIKTIMEAVALNIPSF